ncbi:MAG: hypothetical protein WCT41_01795 [Candidatus Paceibacterota bacterium]
MNHEVEIVHEPERDGVVVRLAINFVISGTEWAARKANNEYRLLAQDASHTLTEKEIAEIDTYI